MKTKILTLITKKIVENTATGKTKFVFDVADESFSIFKILSNFRFILIKYILLYILFITFGVIIIPGLVFYLLNFWLSVLAFFIDICFIFNITYKIVKELPIMIKNEINLRKVRISDSYNQNIKKE